MKLRQLGLLPVLGGTAALLVLLALCIGQPDGLTPVMAQGVLGQNLPDVPADREGFEAPIDAADVAVLESFPPQYMLQLTVGLPNSCAEKGGWEAARSDTTITVKVYDTRPTRPTVCTMIYWTYDLNINLGTEFTTGETYTVQVNAQAVGFEAQ